MKTLSEAIADVLDHAGPMQESKRELRDELVAGVTLDDLTDAERMAVFSRYCTHCGAKDPGCQCWNDE